MALTNRLEFANCPPVLNHPHLSSFWPVKDIHDFEGVHGDWLKHAAVTLVVHHHHEEITAGDLLDHKGPANHSTDGQKHKKKDDEGRREREKGRTEGWIGK